jgi:penicillin amidase
MPTLYNPASGIIASANQKTFPPDYPYNVPGTFADTYRVTQIRSLLSAKRKLTVDDMLAVQKDVYSAYDHFLAKQIVAAYQKIGSKNDLALEAIDILRKWNGQMEKSDAAPVITQFVSKAIGVKLTSALHTRYSGIPRPQIIQTMLQTRPTSWVPQDNWDAFIIDCFNSALNIARGQLGSPVGKWRWGQMLHWKLDHPVGKQLPFVDGLFDIGPVEMSGSGTTVKQTTPRLGPSERMVVDFGDLDKSVQNLVVGESGFVASEHYKDEWPAYYVGTSFPMQFNHVDARETLRVNPAK